MPLVKQGALPAAIANAVEAGVDFIEHAMFTGPDGPSHYDPRVAEALARSGIRVTPTLQVFRDLVDLLPPGAERDGWQARREAHEAQIARLHNLGVPLLAGSDAGWRATRFDTFWKELDELVICGLSPVEAVHAAVGQAVARARDAARRAGDDPCKQPPCHDRGRMPAQMAKSPASCPRRVGWPAPLTGARPTVEEKCSK